MNVPFVTASIITGKQVNRLEFRDGTSPSIVHSFGIIESALQLCLDNEGDGRTASNLVKDLTALNSAENHDALNKGKVKGIEKVISTFDEMAEIQHVLGIAQELMMRVAEFKDTTTWSLTEYRTHVANKYHDKFQYGIASLIGRAYGGLPNLRISNDEFLITIALHSVNGRQEALLPTLLVDYVNPDEDPYALCDVSVYFLVRDYLETSNFENLIIQEGQLGLSTVELVKGLLHNYDANDTSILVTFLGALKGSGNNAPKTAISTNIWE